jgi:2-keto-4-pentenoate hydratase/2-oxohepta-3-ene-1,7-dioic acid hydratase in catechol pathway
MAFKLGSINNRAVLLSEDHYYDLETISKGDLNSSTSEALVQIDKLNDLNENLNNLEASGNLEKVNFDSPVSEPKNCYAVGLNYRNHAEEAGMQIPEVPMIFTKHTSCLVGANADIEMRSNYVDYEAELVVVVGKEGKNISKSDAWSYVAGVCIGQDISDRPTQFAASPAQFNLGKSFDTFGPMGPFLVSPDLVDAEKGLSIECRVNDELRQSDNTNDLIFDVPDIIAYLSEILTLKIGDVIFTGTPGGVGVMEGKFLKDGDILNTSIEGLGTMTNKCVRVKDHSRADFIPEMFKPLFNKKNEK